MTAVNSSGTVSSSLFVGILLALLTVWFLWDLFFAGVELLTLGGGLTWSVAFVALLTSLLYATYRYRRYQHRGY